MHSPQLAWQLYEGHRQASFVAVLACPDPLMPMIIAADTQTNTCQALRLACPFPADKPIFVIFRGVVPGIHHG
jgi:hypothetical protein